MKWSGTKVRFGNNPKSQSDDRLARTIFVGNVPLQTRREKLIKFFKNCGPIESVRFRSIPVKNVKLPKRAAVLSGERLPERDSMNAYVVFENKVAVDIALSLNGSVFQNKHLKIDRDERPTVSVGYCIFVGNLPFDVEDEQVYEVFSKIGSVKYVRIVRDKHTGFGKGFGYVCFKESISVIAAVRMNGSVQVKDRVVRIFRCKNSEKLNIQRTSQKYIPENRKQEKKRKKRGKKGLESSIKKSKKGMLKKKIETA
ncbi:nucleolar RNA-binding protein [Galdieria sulphuraria]|uniref:Nucleolar RNA-binding protein n=1 Tax=Galdieria sulphuraria TaxID=130081 RepID=M2Y813_GALSU|nr:nucleolar RNA-binding protein [Galdieria sulphuraria]EME31969.1 nucleolar RNA-binding protein [Galdieria sulphuraria]|eukprot:XP_005708489.1 nucleolar RNA-binding protein [Galdieria sulphuraria]